MLAVGMAHRDSLWKIFKGYFVFFVLFVCRFEGDQPGGRGNT